jgi:hypothetical protein
MPYTSAALHFSGTLAVVSASGLMSMGHPQISLRTQTNGAIQDFLKDEELVCAHSIALISSLAGTLLNYKDEGVSFVPNVVYCSSIEDFLNTFPGSVFHQIGSTSLEDSAVSRVLKDCAPLSGDNWYIYIQRSSDGKSISYGVFAYFRLPTALSLADGLEINSGQVAILLKKISSNTIEIRGAKGNSLTILFSTMREESNMSKPIAQFAKDCCAGVPAGEDVSGFSIYFKSMLNRLLSNCHGTILICEESGKISAITEMKDHIVINPMLDFHKAFSDYDGAKSAETILALQRCEDLLSGFLRCDGMISFNNLGSVTAYRIFYRPSEAAVGDAPKVNGGARRRAFESLKPLVKKGIVSALFRSQDGNTLYAGEEP